MTEVVTWLSAWLESEAAFVDRATSNLPPAPADFSRIVELNESGDFPARGWDGLQSFSPQVYASPGITSRASPVHWYV